MYITAIILGTLAAIGLIVLIIPKTSKVFHDLMDGKKKLSLKFPTIPSSAIAKKKSPSAEKQSKVQELLHALNEQKPTTKEDIKAIFIQIFGKNASYSILEDYDVTTRFSWLIRFYPPGRGSPNIKFGQTEKGEWFQKEQ